MHEEYDSFIENDTWILQDLPEGRKIVHSKWVYKVKLAADRSVVCFKVQLVAEGFTQKEGLDYKKTFSLVVKFNSIRTILSIVATEDMDIIQFDVCTTFLYGEIHFGATT